jgi:hypothetical protein
MQTNFYFLSPVEVVKVTKDNLEEAAEWCGGKVAHSENKNVKGRIDAYVWVPTPKGTSISWAYPGMFITKRMVRNLKNELKVTFAVFRRDYFEKNYFESPNLAVDATWERDSKAKKEKAKRAAAKMHTENPEAAAGVEPQENFRSAETGQYVTEEFADENPDTTVKEVFDVDGTNVFVDSDETLKAQQARLQVVPDESVEQAIEAEEKVLSNEDV